MWTELEREEWEVSSCTNQSNCGLQQVFIKKCWHFIRYLKYRRITFITYNKILSSKNVSSFTEKFSNGSLFLSGFEWNKRGQLSIISLHLWVHTHFPQSPLQPLPTRMIAATTTTLSNPSFGLRFEIYSSQLSLKCDMNYLPIKCLRGISPIFISF